MHAWRPACTPMVCPDHGAYPSSWSKFYRQTILLGAFASPDLKHMLKAQRNFYGAVTFTRPFAGVISKVVTQLPQAFHRIKCSNLASSPDDRFDFFVNTVLCV